MSSLAKIPSVLRNINAAPVHAIKKLHRLVFRKDGDRNNGKKLRKNSGFRFKSSRQDFNDKFTLINKLSENDLGTITNILGLDYEISKDEPVSDICADLNDLKMVIDKNIEILVVDENESVKNERLWETRTN